MKNINTLNEELNRMKSLMSEERLYGNLVEKKNLPMFGETNKGDNLIGKIKSLTERLFSCINLLDQSYFLLLRSLKLGNFPVIML